MKNKLLIAIIILAAFLRFYKLAEYPVHLGHDEVSQLYDAISIAQTGNDIYGKHLPFIFKSVNDYKPPFYTYATVVAYKLFGWQELTIRITGAFFGTLVILGIYLFVNEFLKNKGIALIAAFLAAISPFEIFYSRKSFENQAGIFIMLLGFFLLKRKKVFSGALLLALSSYVYFAQAVLVPILLGTFIVVFWKDAREYLLKLLIIFLIVSAPLYYMIYTDPDASNRTKAVFITQDQTVGSASKIKLITAASERYIKQFNPKYLFLNGLDMTNGKRDVGPLFPVVAPFLLIGVYLLFRDRKNRANNLFIFVWILIAMIPSGLTFENYSPHRAIAAFTMLNVISAVGIYWFYKRFSRVVLISFLILLILNLGYFIKRYTVNFPIERSEALHYPFREIALYAWENYDKYDAIYFDPKFGEYAPWIGTGAHYYLTYYGHYDPALMQKEFKVGDQTVRETKFGKFSIRAVFWPSDQNLKKTLIIASPWSLPIDISKETNIIKTFYFKTTAPAFYVISL